MGKWTLGIAVVVIFGLPAAVRADGRDEWFKPTQMSVTMSVPAARDFVQVVMSVSKADDARIETSGVSEGKRFLGVLLVVAGTRMLSKGLPVEAGTEIDALDGPVLQVRLACELLGRAFPNGPRHLTAPARVDLVDRKDSIKVNTASAGGEYPAPWTLKGTASADGAGKAFDLVFTCAGMTQPVRLAGRWTAAGPPAELPDSLSTDGWRVFSLGPYSKQDKGGTILDYGAQEIRKKFTNLGAVRRDAAKAAK